MREIEERNVVDIIYIKKSLKNIIYYIFIKYVINFLLIFFLDFIDTLILLIVI